MSEVMDDYDAGYKKGLLAGYAKSIVLIRHLQRKLSSVKDPPRYFILTEAMELIAEKIKPNNK